MPHTDEQTAPPPRGSRLVNYTTLLEYLVSKAKEANETPISDKGLRSRITRGTVPKVPAKPRPGANNRYMFDLDAIDAWLAGEWRKGQ